MTSGAEGLEVIGCCWTAASFGDDVIDVGSGVAAWTEGTALEDGGSEALPGGVIAALGWGELVLPGRALVGGATGEVDGEVAATWAGTRAGCRMGHSYHIPRPICRCKFSRHIHIFVTLLP